MLVARVEPVAQAEDRLLALVALAELAPLVEGRPPVRAMACQPAAEAKGAVRHRLVSTLVVA